MNCVRDGRSNEPISVLGEITREITETRGLLAGCLFTSVEQKMSLKYSGREKEGRGWDGRWGGDVVAKPLASCPKQATKFAWDGKILLGEGYILPKTAAIWSLLRVV